MMFKSTAGAFRSSSRWCSAAQLLKNSSTRAYSSVLKNRALIGGEWVSSGKVFDVVNPLNGKVIASVPDLGEDDANRAIEAAHQAFQSWRWTTAKERSNLLRNWFELCNERQEELARLLTAEMGKPLSEARAEIAYGSSFLEWYSEEARRINGEIVPAPTNSKQMLLTKEPVGVAALITPWNFPNAMLGRKVGPALAAGCTVVVKPAEDTPLSALALAMLAEEAGIPKGVINVVTCSRGGAPAVGKALCNSPKVGALSFTGSTQVGKLLYAQCAGTMKKVSMELGGNAPFIVFDSADVNQAVDGCMKSKFRNTGQTCVATNRVLVQEGIYAEFVSKLKEAVEKSLVLGDGMDDGVNQGPLINESQFKRVCQLVDDAKAKGAKVVTGGGSNPEMGTLFYQPTILEHISPDMDIACNEIFGPVIALTSFKTEEEALAMANSFRTGLAGYFFSQDISQCWRVAKKLEVGMVGVNEGLISCAEAAFGGVKESGIGREGSRHGIDDYVDIKYICFGNLCQ